MRKEIDITITDEGRDRGKTFRLMEMPAMRAEKLATQALMIAARSGVDIPDDMATGGMQAIAVIGIQALLKVSYAEAEPLLDELMTCVQIKPDPRNPGIVRPLVEDDIEEIKTIARLRREVLDLHLGFSTADDRSTQTSGTSAASSSSSNIQTSPDRLVRRSRPGKHR